MWSGDRNKKLPVLAPSPRGAPPASASGGGHSSWEAAAVSQWLGDEPRHESGPSLRTDVTVLAPPLCQQSSGAWRVISRQGDAGPGKGVGGWEREEVEEGLVTWAMAGALGPGSAPNPVGSNKNCQYRLHSRCPAAPGGAVCCYETLVPAAVQWHGTGCLCSGAGCILLPKVPPGSEGPPDL